jgi:hypothetical protein
VYSILILFDISTNIVRLTKLCPVEDYSKVCNSYTRVSIFSSDNLTQECTLYYTITKNPEKNKGLELCGTHHLQVCADNVSLLGENLEKVQYMLCLKILDV